MVRKYQNLLQAYLHLRMKVTEIVESKANVMLIKI